jgi:hypothetical protein
MSLRTMFARTLGIALASVLLCAIFAYVLPELLSLIILPPLKPPVGVLRNSRSRCTVGLLSPVFWLTALILVKPIQISVAASVAGTSIFVF